MSTPHPEQRTPSDDRPSGFPDAAFAHLHSLYRKDIPSLQVAIASATGEHRERLRTVLANLRSEQR
jgi:hypothetical protein